MKTFKIRWHLNSCTLKSHPSFVCDESACSAVFYGFVLGRPVFCRSQTKTFTVLVVCVCGLQRPGMSYSVSSCLVTCYSRCGLQPLFCINVKNMVSGGSPAYISSRTCFISLINSYSLAASFSSIHKVIRMLDVLGERFEAVSDVPWQAGLFLHPNQVAHVAPVLNTWP